MAETVGNINPTITKNLWTKSKTNPIAAHRNAGVGNRGSREEDGRVVIDYQLSDVQSLKG